MSAEPPKKRGRGRPKGSPNKKPTVYDPEKHCGGYTRSRGGAPCTKPKGHRTDHPGIGKCRLHGGAARVLHGRYSKIHRHKATERFHQLLEELSQEPNPLDLTQDLIYLRARMTQLHEQEEKDHQMLADWHESYIGKFRIEMTEIQRLLAARNTEDMAKALNRLRGIIHDMPPKPSKVWDPMAFVKAVNAVSTLVSRIGEQRERQQVPIKAVIDLQDKMALVMMQEIRRNFVHDKPAGDKMAKEIAKAWREINIEF